MVGHVTRPHGTKGEVWVRLLTDHPESAFATGVVLLPAGADGEAPDPDLPGLRVMGTRPFRKGLLVRFGGVEDRSTAELLRNRRLLRPLEEVEPPAEDQLFHHELLGMTVETKEGEVLGEVAEVYELRPADLLELRGPRGSLLIPFTRQILVSVDRDGRRLVVDPPEGLLDL